MVKLFKDDITVVLNEDMDLWEHRFKPMPLAEIVDMLKHIQKLQSDERAQVGDSQTEIQAKQSDSWACVKAVCKAIYAKQKIHFKDEEIIDKIKARDPELKRQIIQHVEKKKNHKELFEQLKKFALENGLTEEYFEPPTFTRYAGKASYVDEAIRLMFIGNSMSEIESRTGLDGFLIQQLKTNEQGQQLHQIQLRQLLENDAQAKINKMQAGVKGKQPNLKAFTTKELRQIDFLKKENIPQMIVGCKTIAEIFEKIRPLVVTYIQSALPLQEIISTINRQNLGFQLTAQDLLDLVLMSSEPDARALMLDSYSEFYPVPLLIADKVKEQPEFFYEFAYFMQPYKTILSFGFKKADLMKCGKSALLDEIFCTNFTSNFGARKQDKPAANIFDLGRIQIQLPRNIDARNPETQWAVIDASRLARQKLIKEFCKHVSIVCIHILAFEILDLAEMKTLKDKLKLFVAESKRVVIFVRDINQLTAEEYEQYQKVAAQLSQDQAFTKCQFIAVRSLVHETDHLLEVENFDLAFNFNNSLNMAKVKIKELLNSKIPDFEKFKPTSIQAILAEFWGDKEEKTGVKKQNASNSLKNDLEPVNQLVNKVNKILQEQLKRVIADRKTGNNKKICDSLISDQFLPNFACYYRIRKYHNEIMKLMAKKLTNEKEIELQQEQEKANSQLDELIDDRMKKITFQMDIINQAAQSEVHKDFTQILNNERSFLQVWLLTQKLHRESKQNPLWQQFLLNQDLFLHNLEKASALGSMNLNLNEMWKLLNRENPENPVDFKKVNSELSVFDFFRESIIQSLYGKDGNEQEQNAKGLSNYLKSGESLELVDGENMRIHDKQLLQLMKHFIDQIREESGGNPMNLYVITQIGKQSVGKSFLLNQVFKTKFLNKSGRCTSGINFALRDMGIDANHKEKLLILDTEGLGSLDKGNRLAGKELDFDRIMVLFSLTISNALIITLKTEIDKETVEILQVCCWALAHLKIDKNDPPHIFFVLNQQADTNSNNYLMDFNRCLDEILNNDIYRDLNIRSMVKLSIDNFFVLPNAFNKETRNYSDIYNFQVQRVLMNHSFNEKCQDLGLSIIKAIRSSNSNVSKRFEHFMTLAGDSFRMITSFPELMKYKSLDEMKCGRLLREYVESQLSKTQAGIEKELRAITDKIVADIQKKEPRQIAAKVDFIDIEAVPIKDKYQEWAQEMRGNYVRYSQQNQFGNHPDIKKSIEQILVSKMLATYSSHLSRLEDAVTQIKTKYEIETSEQKIRDMVVLKNEKVCRLPLAQREKQLKVIYKIQMKNLLIQDTTTTNQKRQDEFMRFFHHQYRLFEMEVQDMHKMSSQMIEKDFILPIYRSVNDLGPMIKNKYFASVAEAATHVLKSQVLAGFKGDASKFKTGMSFIKTNLTPQLKGMIHNVQRRGGGESRFLGLDSIAQAINNNQITARDEFPSEVKPVIEWMIGNTEYADNHKVPIDLQARMLAQMCPVKKQPFTTQIWDVFMEKLEKLVEQKIQQVENEDNKDADNVFDNERKKEIQCLHKTAEAISEMIQDIDHELQYIGCSTNSSARIYLNTLGFFMVMKSKTNRMRERSEAKRLKEVENAARFIDQFNTHMKYLESFVPQEMNREELQAQDVRTAKVIANKIKQTLNGQSANSIITVYKHLLTKMEAKVDNHPYLMQLKNLEIDYKDLFQTSFLFKPSVSGGQQLTDDLKNNLFSLPMRYLTWFTIYSLRAETQYGFNLIDANLEFSLLNFNNVSFEPCSDHEPFPLFNKNQASFGHFPKLDENMFGVLISSGSLYIDMLRVSNLYVYLTALVEGLQ